MANDPHKNLTGSDLHEPKGVAAAAVDKIYVSDGAGSGAWQKLTASQLTGTGNPFGAQLLHVREEQANNTASGTITANSVWTTLVLNTSKTNEISGASLASNQVSLPAGSYYTEIDVPSSFTGASNMMYKLRLRNITDSTSLIISPTYNWTGGGTAGCAFPISVSGRFTLVGTKTIELQEWANAVLYVGSTNRSTGYSEIEVYADLKIWAVG